MENNFPFTCAALAPKASQRARAFTRERTLHQLANMLQSCALETRWVHSCLRSFVELCSTIGIGQEMVRNQQSTTKITRKFSSFLFFFASFCFHGEKRFFFLYCIEMRWKRVDEKPVRCQHRKVYNCLFASIAGGIQTSCIADLQTFGWCGLSVKHILRCYFKWTWVRLGYAIVCIKRSWSTLISSISESSKAYFKHTSFEWTWVY